MRARIKVTDLTLNQWDWLQTNLPMTREFRPDDVRMCVELELTPDFSSTHVEMPVREFMDLMTTLARLETAQAVLTPDALPDHLDDLRNEADPQRAAERGECPDGLADCPIKHARA